MLQRCGPQCKKECYFYKPIVTRNDFRSLARSRLTDARTLLDAGRPDGAYYLLGIAVECGLKACIARLVRRYDFPNKKLTTDSYSHDLSQLVRAAGLEAALNAEIAADPSFGANWLVVKDWTVEVRYSIPGMLKAAALHAAITNKGHGVMRWIRRNW